MRGQSRALDWAPLGASSLEVPSMGGLGVCGSGAAGVDSGRMWPSSSVPWRRAHRQQNGQPPAHTRAAGIWALAARPLPAQARLSALLAWPDVQQASDRAGQSGSGPVGCQSPHSHPPPQLGQGHHMLSQGVGTGRQTRDTPAQTAGPWARAGVCRVAPDQPLCQQTPALPAAPQRAEWYWLQSMARGRRGLIRAMQPSAGHATLHTYRWAPHWERGDGRLQLTGLPGAQARGLSGAASHPGGVQHGAVSRQWREVPGPPQALDWRHLLPQSLTGLPQTAVEGPVCPSLAQTR